MTHVWQRRLLIGLCWFLAFEFTVGAATKFYPGETFFGPPYSVKFVDWAIRPGSVSLSAPGSSSPPLCWSSRIGGSGLWAPRRWSSSW
jgi:hypothetical protein